MGAASAASCTALSSASVALNVSLPNYFPSSPSDSGRGAILTLSQAPCAPPGSTACTGPQSGGGVLSASWAGARLSSNACPLYGVIEIEAAFDFPVAGGAVFFGGGYQYGAGSDVNGNSLDRSWNEVDVAIGVASVENAAGAVSTELAFSGALFTSNPPTPLCPTCSASSSTEDVELFDASPSSCNGYVAPAGSGGTSQGKVPGQTGRNWASYDSKANQHGNNTVATPSLPPFVCPTFTPAAAASYQTYKVIWTPSWLAWTIGTTVFRNTTASPWRPLQMRPLLRTTVGTSFSAAPLPDSHVYLRRLRYIPLAYFNSSASSAAQVVGDALSMPSSVGSSYVF